MRGNQERSQSIARIEERVGAEPNLDERVRILEEALQTFPGEPRLEHLRGVVREKRNLVNSIVGLARLYEQGGEFSEALGQWQTLQIIYGEYPNLDAEIARVKRLRDQIEPSSAPVHDLDNSLDAPHPSGDFRTEELSTGHRDSLEPPLISPTREDAEPSPSYPAATGYFEQRSSLGEPSRFRTPDPRQQSLDELRQLYSQAESATDVPTLENLCERLDAVTSRYPDDAEFQEWSARVRHLFTGMRKSAEGAPAQVPPPDAVYSVEEGQVAPGLPPQFPEPSTDEPPVEKAPPIENQDMQEVRRGGPSIWNRHPDWVLAGVSTLVMVGLAVILGFHYRKHSPPPVPQLTVVVRTLPAGATVRIDAKVCGPAPCTQKLPPGKHQIEALLDGYRSQSKNFTLSGSSSPPPVEISLAPILPALHVSTDMEAGTVWLDNKQIGELQRGEFSQDHLDPGQHTLKVRGANGGAVLNFTVNAGDTAPVTKFDAEKRASAWAISSFGGRARVYSALPAQLSVDGQSLGEVGAAGLDSDNLAHGDHQCTLTAGRTLKRNVSMGPDPALMVFLNTDRNIGTLVVVTGEDDVHVLLDGEEKGITKEGRFPIPDLPVKQYTVEVKKQGYEAVPPQVVQVKRGEETPVVFKLRAIVVMSALHMEGQLPGAQVFLDGNPIGTVKSNGSFDRPDVAPGNHLIGIRDEGYKPIERRKDFGPGATVRLSPADFALELIQGRLIVEVSPPTENIELRAADEPVGKRIKPRVVTSLPPGTYTVTARWEGGDERTVQVTILADKDSSVTLSPHPGGMENWENPAGWILEDKWFVHHGGDFVLYHRQPSIGRFEFTVQLRKGHHLQWVVDYVNQNNYILFQMDEKSLRREQIVNGKHDKQTKNPNGMGKGHMCTFRIEVQRNNIVHQRYEGSAWVTVDTMTDPNGDFGGGKIGFVIPANEIVALSNFKFTPE